MRFRDDPAENVLALEDLNGARGDQARASAVRTNYYRRLLAPVARYEQSVSQIRDATGHAHSVLTKWLRRLYPQWEPDHTVRKAEIHARARRTDNLGPMQPGRAAPVCRQCGSGLVFETDLLVGYVVERCPRGHEERALSRDAARAA